MGSPAPTTVLVLCLGNICRSPVGAAMLAVSCPALRVASAGLQAAVGLPVDPPMLRLAKAAGLDLGGHRARQFTDSMGAEFDLLLVMESDHRRLVSRMAPQLLGRTLLFGHWLSAGRQDIADPYRRGDAFHAAAFNHIRRAADLWAAKLGNVAERTL